MEDGKMFGSRLRTLIKERGLEQRKIAADLGINPVTFSGYVINKREPSFARLNELAGYFGVSADYLLGRSDVRDPYMKHLSGDLEEFVREPENSGYIELARDIKIRAENITDLRKPQGTS